ncbi:hypothetical protein QTO34_006225 [Cnephaeus nilssonii]|uniref:Uncharacterized protein n=1 Tax=Cnephaeus nilssonii TaxID=3371016 RepID=A0AA40HN62_CNENI|nr:hypothetical protein QTO34_006225 [Eptesicus nilssonii]
MQSGRARLGSGPALPHACLPSWAEGTGRCHLVAVGTTIFEDGGTHSHKMAAPSPLSPPAAQGWPKAQASLGWWLPSRPGLPEAQELLTNAQGIVSNHIGHGEAESQGSSEPGYWAQVQVLPQLAGHKQEDWVGVQIQPRGSGRNRQFNATCHSHLQLLLILAPLCLLPLALKNNSKTMWIPATERNKQDYSSHEDRREAVQRWKTLTSPCHTSSQQLCVPAGCPGPNQKGSDLHYHHLSTIQNYNIIADIGPVHDLIMHLVHQLAVCPLVPQAFRKPPAPRRLSKGLAPAQTDRQLPRFGF